MKTQRITVDLMNSSAAVIHGTLCVPLGHIGVVRQLVVKIVLWAFNSYQTNYSIQLAYPICSCGRLEQTGLYILYSRTFTLLEGVKDIVFAVSVLTCVISVCPSGLSVDRPCARSVKVDSPCVFSQVCVRGGVVWALSEHKALFYREGLSSYCSEGEGWKYDTVR